LLSQFIWAHEFLPHQAPNHRRLLLRKYPLREERSN
jgi:hypothetical protein